ncbi:hypothetical protein BT69DRAFT_1323260 [Atractiella rhizophila]|nr:hypothetical protein BT69DRAFT_1323260 [Atractiella rhizophila]
MQLLFFLLAHLLTQVVAQYPTPTPTASPVAPLPSSTPIDHVGWTRFERKVLGHAILGGLTFTVFSPTAILIARWFRGSRWFPFHASLQTLTFCTTLTGFVLINVAVYEKVHYYEIWNYGPHHRMGIFVFGFVMIQFFLGGAAYTFLKPITERYRRIVNWCHMVLGITITTLGYIQVYLGFHHWENLSNPRESKHVPTAVRVIYWILVATEITVYFLGVWRDRRNYFQLPVQDGRSIEHLNPPTSADKDSFDAKSPTTATPLNAPQPWYNRQKEENYAHPTTA